MLNSAQKESAKAGTSGAQQYNQHVHYSEAPITTLLSRLDKVRETGRGQYLACCPAHDDKHPSLSVRETGDGTVLLHCFGLCPAGDVLAAVGMELRDLFPQRYESRPKRRYERRINPMDALRALDHEAHVLAVVAADVHAHREIDAPTWQRLRLAVSRIGAARGLYQ